MPKQYGKNSNFKGNENSGRKTIGEELNGAVEKITNEALIELAKQKVKLHLDKNLNFTQTKEMALPITLKGMTEVKDINVNLPQPILNVYRNNSDQENNADEKENKNLPGRNRSIQNGFNHSLLDSPGAIGQSTDFDEHSERELSPLEKRSDTGLPDDNEGA